MTMGMGGRQLEPSRMRSTPFVARVMTNAVMTAATGVLEFLDCVLVAFHAFRAAASIALGFMLRHRSSTVPKPTVVIVGASFAGLWAQRALYASCSAIPITSLFPESKTSLTVPLPRILFSDIMSLSHARAAPTAST